MRVIVYDSQNPNNPKRVLCEREITNEKHLLWFMDDVMHKMRSIKNRPNYHENEISKEHSSNKTIQTITKEFHFCYGHYLPEYKGKCRNPHGHNAKLEVTIQGDIKSRGPNCGMIEDFSIIKGIVNPLIEMIDHKMLNDDLPEFGEYDDEEGSESGDYHPPTAENIARWFWDKIWDKINETKDPDYYPLRLHSIRLWETPTSYTEIKAQ